MFVDLGWIHARENRQYLRDGVWRRHSHHPVTVEIGAGMAIPLVRMFSGNHPDGFLILINPKGPQLDGAKESSLATARRNTLQRIAMALIEQVWKT